jgi:hypothetical protein
MLHLVAHRRKNGLVDLATAVDTTVPMGGKK